MPRQYRVVAIRGSFDGKKGHVVERYGAGGNEGALEYDSRASVPWLLSTILNDASTDGWDVDFVGSDRGGGDRGGVNHTAGYLVVLSKVA